MSYETILVEAEDGVGIVTLNRPDSLNAMNRLLNRELHEAIKGFEADDGIGCIVLTGAGRASRPAATSTSSARMTAATARTRSSRLRSGRTSLDVSISQNRRSA